MRGISRREFGTLVFAGVPFGVARKARPPGGLTIGVTSASFREFPRAEGRDNIDDILAALRAIGASHVELALSNVEPAPPSVAPFMGGTPAYPRVVVLTPEEIAATNAHARRNLRDWRLRTGSGLFEGIAARFRSAGVVIHGCTVTYNDSFTDEEIDATFRQVKALGVGTVSSPLTARMAARLVPFAERHSVEVAIHNQDGSRPEHGVSSTHWREVLALSPVFTLKLDVGNVTAANGDPVVELGELHTRLSYVVLKDRLRNGGPSQPFGEGDTPLRAVISRLKAGSRPVPALVEYDYIGLRPAGDEVSASMRYVAAL